jgi:hypothetical protein
VVNIDAPDMTTMTILARRFTILCLGMAVFAVGLTMVIQHSDRRAPLNSIGLSATCSPAGSFHCRFSL